MTIRYWRRALRELSAGDPVMARLIRSYPGEGLASRAIRLARWRARLSAPVISGWKAAWYAWTRLETALVTVSLQQVLAQDEAALRACGLSARKASYLGDPESAEPATTDH